ncbi:MAG: 7-cyano-7-deazaguanine synthase QueC [Phycisphaerae bacterium]|nr:7-cyano-7-deazaguanine synthase QueC [Phycisphaerae bacterium]MDG1899743.1 7-cyano-7-deazaguanine synthase QueC [Phycisphaerales bacterium]|tara:strand:- start:10470 stop:11156 length:687 start_codon:yes stop_codon:yes gene_type:complete
MRAAVLLVSGGLDSATVLAIARDQGYMCHAVSFDYGQRHRHELKAAVSVCSAAGIASHRTVILDPTPFSGSALTDGGDVPMDRSEDAMGSGIPDTYVPARNLVFLSYALGIAEGLGSSDIFIGVNAIDYSGYPDCRGEFIESFQETANLATRSGVDAGSIRIHAPLLEWTKAQIITRGQELGVEYGLTTSCYAPAESGAPCTRCDACRLRAIGFEQAGVEDPLRRRYS